MSPVDPPTWSLFSGIYLPKIQMILKRIIVGPFQANCYLIGCEATREAAIVDPGGSEERILHLIRETDVEVIAVINTHGHCDHMGANRPIQAETGAPILIHERDADLLTNALTNGSTFFYLKPMVSPPADRRLADGDEVQIGEITIRVSHTPGHTPGGLCVLLPENGVLTGDTLFRGSIGRTDLPGGSYDTLIRSIHQKLMVFDDGRTIYPGHGEPSTIGWERQHNPFL